MFHKYLIYLAIKDWTSYLVCLNEHVIEFYRDGPKATRDGNRWIVEILLLEVFGVPIECVSIHGRKCYGEMNACHEAGPIRYNRTQDVRRKAPWGILGHPYQQAKITPSPHTPCSPPPVADHDAGKIFMGQVGRCADPNQLSCSVVDDFGGSVKRRLFNDPLNLLS